MFFINYYNILLETTWKILFNDLKFTVGNGYNNSNPDIPITNFRNNPLKFTLIKDEEENNTFIDVINPSYTKHVANRIKREINKYYFDRVTG